MSFPIFTGAVNGKPVRFYLSPVFPADAPWPAYSDLAQAVRYCDACCDGVLAWHAREHPEHVSRVKDGGNILAIVSFEVGTLIVEDTSLAQREAQRQYRIAAMRAYYIALALVPGGEGVRLLEIARKPAMRSFILDRAGENVGQLLLDTAAGGVA